MQVARQALFSRGARLAPVSNVKLRVREPRVAWFAKPQAAVPMLVTPFPGFVLDELTSPRRSIVAGRILNALSPRKILS
jgi:hypothetical protein